MVEVRLRATSRWRSRTELSSWWYELRSSHVESTMTGTAATKMKARNSKRCIRRPLCRRLPTRWNAPGRLARSIGNTASIIIHASPRGRCRRYGHEDAWILRRTTTPKPAAERCVLIFVTIAKYDKKGEFFLNEKH